MGDLLSAGRPYDILVCVYAHLLLTAGNVLKLNSTVNKCEESVIRSDTNVVAGMNLSSTLSYKDITCDNSLTVSLLNAKSLGLGITAVLGRTNTLFMSKEL